MIDAFPWPFLLLISTMPEGVGSVITEVTGRPRGLVKGSAAARPPPSGEGGSLSPDVT